MRALLLVGGEGTRLRPLTYTTPKQMLPVAEVPMIERNVAHLVSHGVTDVVLSLGYRADAFMEAYPDRRCAGATLTFVVEDTPLDTAGAVRYAATEAGVDEPFLVVNTDVLTDIDLTALIAFHTAAKAEGTIALTPVSDPSPFGVVPTTPEGRVEAFIEKPAPGTAPTNMINAGFYVLEPSVITRIPSDRRVNIEKETFPTMVADGTLYALGSDVYWLDVGTPERYLTATSDLVAGRRPGPPAPGARETTPGVWQLGAATLDGKAARALLADGACVGSGAVVEESVVGAGAVIGEGAILTRSVVLAGASVGPRALIEDSVVGPAAVVGAGARLSAWSVLGRGASVDEGARCEGERVPA